MTEHLIISGERVPAQSGETFNVTEPATGQVLAEVAKAGQADVDLALAAAHQAFASALADPGGLADLLGRAAADAEHVGEGDDEPLLAGNVDAVMGCSPHDPRADSVRLRFGPDAGRGRASRC